jgi:hypothetical protein
MWVADFPGCVADFCSVVGVFGCLLSRGSGWLFTVEPGAGHRSDEDSTSPSARPMPIICLGKRWSAIGPTAAGTRGPTLPRRRRARSLARRRSADVSPSKSRRSEASKIEGGGSVHSREEEKLGGGETDSPRHRFLKRPNYLGTSIGMPTYTNLGSGAGPSATITVLTGASDTLT